MTPPTISPSPAACAIIGPIALGFAGRYHINPLLMGMFVVHGAQAGGFSPISIYGTITNSVMSDNDLPDGEIVYAGDGYSDYCAALAADRVFATGSLARYLDERRVPYEPLTDFVTLASAL